MLRKLKDFECIIGVKKRNYESWNYWAWFDGWLAGAEP